MLPDIYFCKDAFGITRTVIILMIFVKTDNAVAVSIRVYSTARTERVICDRSVFAAQLNVCTAACIKRVIIYLLHRVSDLNISEIAAISKCFVSDFFISAVQYRVSHVTAFFKGIFSK